MQSTTGLCGSGAGLGGGPATAAQYHASLEGSIARHFPGGGGMGLINCMCHSTGALAARPQAACLGGGPAGLSCTRPALPPSLPSLPLLPRLPLQRTCTPSSTRIWRACPVSQGMAGLG